MLSSQQKDANLSLKYNEKTNRKKIFPSYTVGSLPGQLKFSTTWSIFLVAIYPKAGLR